MVSAIFPKSFSRFRENLMTRQVFLIVVPTVSQRALQLLVRDFTTTLSECPWQCVVTILVCLSVICFETSKFFPIMLPAPLKVWPLQLTSFKWNPIKISLRAFTVVSLIKLFNSYKPRKSSFPFKIFFHSTYTEGNCSVMLMSAYSSTISAKYRHSRK